MTFPNIKICEGVLTLEEAKSEVCPYCKSAFKCDITYETETIHIDGDAENEAKRLKAKKTEEANKK